MDSRRQQAFQKVRPSCVQLSSTALEFKAKQKSIKDVLHALEDQNRALLDASNEYGLDAKLAEYAFFPLTHVFNESQNLSPGCLEVAVDNVTILVGQGWRQQLGAEMGKQLLILMSLLAGGDSRKGKMPPTDELKAAAFTCMATVVKELAAAPQGRSVLDNQTAKNVVDQIVYVLVESISEAVSDSVQTTATGALLEVFRSLNSAVFLASLLPRTVSSLVKALRPSTQIRRTSKVLCGNLHLLQIVLQKVLADDGQTVSMEASDASNTEILDATWLKATSTQVRNALVQVVNLRNHDHGNVRKALADLCIMVVEDCEKTLSNCASIMIETLVILSESHEDISISSTLNRLLAMRPELRDALRDSFYDWTQSLPRVMQTNDDKPKGLLIKKIANAFNLIGDGPEADEVLIQPLTTALVNGIASNINRQPANVTVLPDAVGNSLRVLASDATRDIKGDFQGVLFRHQSQKELNQQLTAWMGDLKRHPMFGKLTRNVVDAVASNDRSQKLAALWLSIQLLKKDDDSPSLDLEDLILTDSAEDKYTSRAYLIYDLYSAMKDVLTDRYTRSAQETDWQLIALTLETVVLQAQQLGNEYRNELYETLYPIIALFSSDNAVVHNNAISALNMLANACQYDSATNLLIENVDYLVNSIAWKLNTFDLSPEAPQVLNMVVKLVGARLLPYLDDLIASIFAALDNYHGYPIWVEVLFTVLKTIIDESSKQPELALGHEIVKEQTNRRIEYATSPLNNILENLQARKKRKHMHARDEANEELHQLAPRRPWTREQDDPSYQSNTQDEDISIESILKQDEEGDLPAPNMTENDKEKDVTAPLSKSHDLLLQIARATVPHLGSPSPKVRHLILKLLKQISPLLSHHENTFLPLINAIWPAIISRLFANQIENIDDFTDRGNIREDGEFGYNIIAAADLVAQLCENAGDFMSTRIEQISTQLIRLFTQTYNRVEAGRKTRSTIKNQDNTIYHRQEQQQRQLLSTDISSQNDENSVSNIIFTTPENRKKNPNIITGAVDLQIVKSSQSSPPPPQQQDDFTLSLRSNQPQKPTPSNSSALRTSSSHLLTSLLKILTNLLLHVRLSLDQTDKIITTLIPILKGNYGSETEKVRSAISNFNPDILWILMERDRVEREVEFGLRGDRDQNQDRRWKKRRSVLHNTSKDGGEDGDGDGGEDGQEKGQADISSSSSNSSLNSVMIPVPTPKCTISSLLRDSKVDVNGNNSVPIGFRPVVF